MLRNNFKIVPLASRIWFKCTYSWYVKNDNRKKRHANTSALPTIPVT